MNLGPKPDSDVWMIVLALATATFVLVMLSVFAPR